MDFAGGAGLNNKLGYELIKPKVAPLSPENVVIFGSGALGGTLAPCSSRIFATTKFPVNGTIGTASGGSCGDALKLAGYSQVVITGVAEKPVFVKIFDGDVEVCDACDLWGKDIWQTVDELRRRYGRECSVIAIGPAGERLSAISLTFANKNGHLGRGGLPAVMGSKNLKALLIRGRKGIKLADQGGFMKIVNSLYDRLTNLPYRDDWLGLGIGIGYWGRRSTWGQKPPAEEAANPYSSASFEKTWKSCLTCPTCPVSCKSVIELKTGKYAGTLVPMTGIIVPIESFQRLGVPSLDQAYELGDLCNRSGIDMLDFSGITDMAITLYEEGEITKEDTDGLELKRGYETVKKLLDKVVCREGFGALLADGFPAFARAIGKKGQEYITAVTVKGHEPMMDPRRHFHTWNITEMVNPRSPWGQPGNSPTFQPERSPEELANYLRRLLVSEDAIERTCSPSSINMARLAKYAEDFYSLCSCLGICVRVPLLQSYNPSIAAQLFNAATGLKTEAREFMRVGERAWNMLKAANVREGFDRKDDKFPKRFFGPLVTEGKSLSLKDYYGGPLNEGDIEKLLNDYYDERGWDLKRGIPTRKKLVHLGLGWVADDLYKQGVPLAE